MNILLIRPEPHRATIGLQSLMICEPLELMTLAAVLLVNGHNVTILDMIVEWRSLKHFIRKYRPDLVGVTGYIHTNARNTLLREIQGTADCSVQPVRKVGYSAFGCETRQTICATVLRSNHKAVL